MFFNSVNPFSFAKRIGRPLILDGAMGSMLQKKIKGDEYLWMSKANLDDPELVLEIYNTYIKVGADIITTNTFRTNPISVKKHKKLKVDNIVKKSVDIAKFAKNDLPVFIAGSNPPAEDCYQKERNISYNKLKINHHNHIKLLNDNKVNFILNETQSHYDEIKIICSYCFKNNIPYVLSLYFDDNLKLLSGERVTEVIPYILKHAPLAIGFNCIKPKLFNKLTKEIRLDFNWGIYFNCGGSSVYDKKIKCEISPIEYGKIIKQLLNYSPSFVGACCGSSPNHIKEIKKIVDGNSKS